MGEEENLFHDGYDNAIEETLDPLFFE